MKRLFYISMAALMVLGAVSCKKDSDKKSSGSKNANCYIVSAPGTYSFLAVKGNSSESVGEVDDVKVLWESSAAVTKVVPGDIIAGVYCNLPDPGQPTKITYITPSTLQNGNALIAAYDSDGNILWSWHIWVCEGYDPSAKAQSWGGGTPKMMDRNLGATSASPGSAESLGLMYQWGRKDPFPGGASIEDNKIASTTIAWPQHTVCSSESGTIEYATRHPQVFIESRDETHDWLYDNTVTGASTRWSSKKSIYDPCPAGWRVPDGGEKGFWAKALGAEEKIAHDFNTDVNGMLFGSNNSIFVPASGYLDYSDAKPYCIGTEGYCWTCTYSPEYEQAYEFKISYSDDVSPFSLSDIAYGDAVRCCKE